MKLKPRTMTDEELLRAVLEAARGIREAKKGLKTARQELAKRGKLDTTEPNRP